jgi:hypothetical protein
MMEPLDTPEDTLRHHARLVARLAAEPLVLATWHRETENPRLSAAYQALMERTTQRAAALAEAMPEARGEISAGAARSVAEASLLTFEPSRLKWLLAGRRDRLGTPDLKGHAEHRSDEAREADHLEVLLDELLQAMC